MSLMMKQARVTPPASPSERLINELQSFGVRLADPKDAALSRRGGAGPSDHKAMTVDGMTVMVPVFTATAFESPYLVERPDATGRTCISRDGLIVGEVNFPATPNFYKLKTADGVPYSQIATLHGRDVLATTVLQSCIRYQSRSKSCRFCAIGQSLAAGRTIERKTPAQLAEVARAAVELDGVTHMVMTTGTPPGADRGAAMLAESAAAVKAAVDLPIQVQCEPPGDHAWFGVLRDAGAEALGMHLEAVTEPVRHKIMPGKAQISVEIIFPPLLRRFPFSGAGRCRHTSSRVLVTRPRKFSRFATVLHGWASIPLSCPSCRFPARRWKAIPRPALTSCTRSLGGCRVCSRPMACAPPTSRRDAAAAVPVRRWRPMNGPGEQGRTAMIFEPFAPYLPCEFQLKFATEPWEKRGAFGLRRKVFCGEQGLFGDDDRDEFDEVAIALVALSLMSVVADDVVGTVRIHEAEPGLWWGSRLAVARDFRRIGALGAGLIQLAVGSAHACGCKRFLAHVQSQNAMLFQKMHWTILEEVELHGRPHFRMAADLAHYPPIERPDVGFLAMRKAA